MDGVLTASHLSELLKEADKIQQTQPVLYKAELQWVRLSQVIDVMVYEAVMMHAITLQIRLIKLKICGANYPLSIAFIVVNEFCERFSYYGMKAVLTLYFIYFLHWDEDLSTTVYHAFTGLCYFTPIFGAIIADAWLGKFKTIIYLSIIYVIGHIVKSVGAIPTIGDQTTHAVLAMVGLFLIALGTGGIKPCVSAFGGDQFEEEHAQERSKFFSVFYLAINAGSLISTFVTPVLRADVQCFGGDCFALAFGVPAALMVVALVVFIGGSGMYYKSPPQGNILADVSKCIGFAIKNRWRHRSSQYPKRKHWLDWAEEKYSKRLIKEIKMVTRVLFLYIPLPMFWALFDQQGSRWTLQATRMNPDFGTFVLQPDHMQSLNPLLILVFIPICDFAVYPLVNMCANFTPIRKMVVGMMIAALAFGAAAVVETQVTATMVKAPAARESLLQIINLGDQELTASLQENNNQFTNPIGPFEDPKSYEKLKLESEAKAFQFNLNIGGMSAPCEQILKENEAYSLLVYKSNHQLHCKLIVDRIDKPPKGQVSVRFVNTLGKVVDTVTIGKENFDSIEGNYEVSDYKTVSRGKHTATCTMEGKLYQLDLGLLDFGAVYTVFITEASETVTLANKTEDIPANSFHIAWQIPQYVLLSAGEVMFSITGLEFSYSQAPISMKAVLTGGWLLTVAFGNVIVLIVAQAGSLEQWAEFVLFAVLLLVVSIIFAIMGYFYRYVDPSELKTDDEDEKVKKADDELKEHNGLPLYENVILNELVKQSKL
ncbi:solute carrier family 15 member 2-like [Protopterus annectens]|uniref:solute carrier family 15 member 2-like n=1 Tax=Protopterus annectens TaxID=7888 RepID=UPI001CF94D0E|nr:solute carrier family 15 member 2-like [Protopterus annectens]